MEVPLYLWRIWRGCIHFNILSIFGDFGTADSALRICGWTCQPEKYGTGISETGAEGEPLSSYEMAEYCWLLYADDVLYDGGRMDFVLCLPFSDRTASWSG